LLFVEEFLSGDELEELTAIAFFSNQVNGFIVLVDFIQFDDVRMVLGYLADLPVCVAA
jgi:hypothetical protein